MNVKGRVRKRQSILRNGRACVWCGIPLTRATATLDHLVPRSRGGHGLADNIVPACERCNGQRGNHMARRAIIIRQITDAFGDRWDAREARPTDLGWPVWMGWPEGMRGRGYGGPRAIITPSLRRYLVRTRINDVSLPIGRSTVKRLRRVLRLDWRAERRAWWEQRAAELGSMTGAEFASKHGLTDAIVSLNYKAMFGRRIRPVGWYLTDPARSLLLSDAPRAYVADELDISIGAVGRLRWVLRQDDASGIVPTT